MNRKIIKPKNFFILTTCLVMVIATIAVTLAVNTTSSTRLAAKASTSNYCAPPSVTTTTPDTIFNSYFNQQTGPGWVGGDATYFTKLPDGRAVWSFSDTLIGTASLSGQASFKGMPHNTLLVGNGSALATDVGGTFTSPQSL